MVGNTFRTTFEIPSYPFEIGCESKILTLGSCFAEHIGCKLKEAKFDSSINPFGIIYNPSSIGKALSHGLSNSLPGRDMIVEHGGLFHSLLHHGRFSKASRSDLERGILTELTAFHTKLQELDILLITFGSAHTYRYLENGQVVANCHKISGDRFRKELLGVEFIVDQWHDLLKHLFHLRPQLKVLFSVSPVRYIRDGAIENQRSKATLILAISELTQVFESCHYFPAYELLLDDLRDYRFYDHDMLHPSKVAVDYIWEHFRQTLLDSDARKMYDEMKQLDRLLKHRPIHPGTLAHQDFIKGTSEKILRLKEKYPNKDFGDEDRWVSKHSLLGRH